MKIEKTVIEGVVVIEPRFSGEKMIHFEAFRMDKFIFEVSNNIFIQEFDTFASYGYIHGIHYQMKPFTQSRLVRVISGEILCVAIDLRVDSNTFGMHTSVRLSGDNHKSMFIPAELGYGYSVLSSKAIINTKCDNYFDPLSEFSVRYDDRDLNINWQIDPSKITLDEKDRVAPRLEKAKLGFSNQQFIHKIRNNRRLLI